MNKRRAFKSGSMRNRLLIVAAVTVGLASIAYAAYSQTLTVSGTGTASGAWNVGITAITLTGSDGATQVSGPSYTGHLATFNVDLANPGAYADYAITVTNGGSIPAILQSLTDTSSINAAAPSYITYTVTGVTAGTTTLGTNPGVDNTNTIDVHVEWTAGTNPDTGSDNSKAATLEFDYAQNTT